MIKILKVGLLGGILCFLSFAVFTFTFAIPFLYTTSLFKQLKPWYLFYEIWSWDDLITLICEGFFDLAFWRLFMVIFLAGFFIYARLAFLARRQDFG